MWLLYISCILHFLLHSFTRPCKHLSHTIRSKRETRRKFPLVLASSALLKKKQKTKKKHLEKIPWLTNIHHVGEQDDVTPHLWHHTHDLLVEARLGAMLPLRISEARASVSRRFWHLTLTLNCVFIPICFLYSMVIPKLTFCVCTFKKERVETCWNKGINDGFSTLIRMGAHREKH